MNFPILNLLFIIYTVDKNIHIEYYNNDPIYGFISTSLKIIKIYNDFENIMTYCICTVESIK